MQTDKSKIIYEISMQLSAMQCSKYKVGIYNREQKTMLNLNYLTNKDLLISINRLQIDNNQGKDIFIGQSNNIDRALILVDDLNVNQIDLMSKRGVSPTCVIETSPDNFQVWVSLGDQPMPKDQRKIVASIFAKEFGGDQASTAANHYGRLAGFTNRKPKYFTKNGYPLIRCHHSTGLHAEKSNAIREWAIKQTIKEKQKHEKRITVTKSYLQNNNTFDPNNAFSVYFDQWLEHANKCNLSQDLSRGDFAVACRMLKEGYRKDDIINALIINSPDIENRKGKYTFDYATRTIFSALKYI